MAYFVLIGFQRTGTNLLREVVNSNPRLFLYGEVFSVNESPSCWHKFKRTPEATPYSPLDFDQAVILMDSYLSYLRDEGPEHTRDGAAWLGFDVKYDQLHCVRPFPSNYLTRILRRLGRPAACTPVPYLLRYLRLRDIPIIHMLRRNVLHVAISVLIAWQRDRYHNYEHATFHEKYPVKPRLLLRIARKTMAERKAFEQLAEGLRLLPCEYEDLVNDLARRDEAGRFPPDTRVLRSIARFLGVPNTFSYDDRLRKTLNKPYAQIISNYKQVVRAVRNSEFEAFADTI